MFITRSYVLGVFLRKKCLFASNGNDFKYTFDIDFSQNHVRHFNTKNNCDDHKNKKSTNALQKHTLAKNNIFVDKIIM